MLFVDDHQPGVLESFRFEEQRMRADEDRWFWGAQAAGLFFPAARREGMTRSVPHHITLRPPHPRIILVRSDDLRVPGIACDIRKFFVQVPFRTNRPIEPFLFPNWPVCFLDSINRMRSEGFDRVQDLSERIEDPFVL